MKKPTLEDSYANSDFDKRNKCVVRNKKLIRATRARQRAVAHAAAVILVIDVCTKSQISCLDVTTKAKANSWHLSFATEYPSASTQIVKMNNGQIILSFYRQIPASPPHRLWSLRR